jgi:3-keto-disaccharide hydrolase
MKARLLLVGLCLGLLISCDSSKEQNGQSKPDPMQKEKSVKPEPNKPVIPKISADMPPGEVSLFDGKTLGLWKITDFGGQGKVYAKENTLQLEMGNDMTGVTWSGPVLTMNYELNLDAMRVEGSDFFCGLTFPVEKNSVSFVVGGWGGYVCGISCVNYYDASENETSKAGEFESNKWYHIRIRVTPEKIDCWIDDEQYVDLDTKDKKLDVRLEMEDSKPLGIATWRTASAIRNIYLTKLPD